MPRLSKGLAVCLALVLMSASGCTSRPKTLLQEAENLWFNNQYREAVRVFLQVVDRYPDSEEAETALLRVGETFMLNLSNHEKAIEYFTRLTIDYPNSDKALMALESMADLYEKSLKDYDRAIIQYQKLMDSPRLADKDRFQFAIARCFYHKGSYEQAILEYRTLIDNFPNSDLVSEAWYQIGNCYFVMNNCDKAINQYNKTLENFPGTKRRNDILFSVGVCLEEKEEYGQALQNYREIKDGYGNKALVERKINAVLARMKSKNR